jgi:hypothetical protein
MSDAYHDGNAYGHFAGPESRTLEGSIENLEADDAPLVHSIDLKSVIAAYTAEDEPGDNRPGDDQLAEKPKTQPTLTTILVMIGVALGIAAAYVAYVAGSSSPPATAALPEAKAAPTKGARAPAANTLPDICDGQTWPRFSAECIAAIEKQRAP